MRLNVYRKTEDRAPGARRPAPGYTVTMRFLLAAIILASGISLVAQQKEGEKPVPKDSTRVVLQGCATGRTFIVGPRSEHGAANLQIEPGRRFRLEAKKPVLEEIKKGEKTMVEVTGLIRKADLQPPGGVTFAGGRVRVGGTDPRQPVGGSASSSTPYNQITMDVESSRPLPEPCPAN